MSQSIDRRNVCVGSTSPQGAPTLGFYRTIVVCPRCKSDLDWRDAVTDDNRAVVCANQSCDYARLGFPAIASRPILVDFEHSVVSREAVQTSYAASTKARNDKKSAIANFKRTMLRSDGPTRDNLARFLSAAKQSNPTPIVLVIGGGTVGTDAEALYSDPAITVISSDIYISDLTAFVADGHQLPVKSGSVDGVWIQAVLEHVLSPDTVVAEIHRILRKDGVVYAETPFLQHVHEGPYDFTRFTLSGHRWLFKNFAEIDAGITRGPGTVAIWTIRHLASSVFRNKRAGAVAAVAFFWLKYFDALSNRRFAVDAASGVYFLGRRSPVQSLSPHEIIAYYKGAQ